tara:strand:+ start:1359 stop:1907 length:549 start_codon:yes stop_codon:yes gene_type:complete
MNTNTIKLTNVRLSFPSLWREKKFAPTDAKGAYSATFVLDKVRNKADIKLMDAAIEVLIKDVFKGKRLPKDKVCFRDGSDKPDTDGFGDGVMYVSSRTDKRPLVVARDTTPLIEEDGKPYAGCYVNATIELWGQDNQYGKRINARLRAVQFFKDGEAFGGARIDPTKEFSAIPDDDDDESPV